MKNKNVNNFEEKLANYDFDDYDENTNNKEMNSNNTNNVEDQTYDILGDDYLIDDDEERAIEGENMEDYNERVRKSGVVYLSYIPSGVNSTIIREKFENYGVNRIFLVPGKQLILLKLLKEKTNDDEKEKVKKKCIYKEGWVEFKSKIMAKFCEFQLNGKQIGKMLYKIQY